MGTRQVLKVGGSVLERPDAPERLRLFLADHFSGAQVNVIVGGGSLIDVMRQWDTIHSLDPIALHWRCVRALRFTFELVGDWLPDARRIESPADFAQHVSSTEAGVYLLAIDSFYSPMDAEALPQNWSTTSDSIAALLATKLSIHRLWLLKSCDVAKGMSIQEASSQGIVDQAFAKVSRSLDVKWAKL